MRALTIGLVSACLFASPSFARSLTMPTPAEMHLLRSFLTASPPDFEGIASRSDVAQSATEFDKAEIVAREAERLREAYVGIGEVDRIFIRLDSGLSRYDGAAGGFRLRALEPDRYVAFNHEKLLFENSAAFAVWKLSPSDGRRVLDEVGSGRSVQIEIEAVPFAASPTDRLAVRSQIRALRIATRDGVTLGEMRSADPEAERVLPGHTTRSTVPEERLEVLGLKVGATYDDFREWVSEKGFESDTIDGPPLQKWRYELDFAAEPGVIPPPSDMPMPPRESFWAPMPITGERFACDATDPTRRICGSVTFSPDPAVEDKAITSIRIAQTIGSKPDTVRASLVEKFGPPSDDFQVTLPTWNGDVEARQVVWGTPKPRNDDTLGSTALTDAGKTWQIEAIIIDRGSGGTVLIVQVSGTPATVSDAPAEARL